MSKTFRDIPAQATLMLDTNVVVYALFPQSIYHLSCKELLERGARGELQLRLTVSAAADLVHRAAVASGTSRG